MYMDNLCYVSYDKKFIYLPIQKNACSSMKLALSPYLGVNVSISDKAKKDIMSDLDSFENLYFADLSEVLQ